MRTTLPRLQLTLRCASYGTRLEKDIVEEKSGEHKHLLGVPKPLVPVGGKPLVSHWTRIFGEECKFDLARDVFVVTNKAHYERYVAWAKTVDLPADNIVNDGSTSNDTRIGAIGDIALVISSKKIEDDLLIVGGALCFLVLQRVVIACSWQATRFSSMISTWRTLCRCSSSAATTWSCGAFALHNNEVSVLRTGIRPSTRSKLVFWKRTTTVS